MPLTRRSLVGHKRDNKAAYLDLGSGIWDLGVRTSGAAVRITERSVQALRAEFHPMKAENGRVLVALVHETLKMEQFDTIADLSEAVKVRAARLRIPYEATRLTEALRAVARTRQLVAGR